MIIGITGLKGSGKGEASNVLMDLGYHRMKMAGILKSMLLALGLSESEIEGEKKEVPCDLLGGKTPRWAMQALGTEYGRNLIHPDLWVNAMRHKLKIHTKVFHWRSIVIDDIRFPNEVALIKEFSGQMWRVVRPGLLAEDHPSESQVMSLPVDLEIENSGDLQELATTVTAQEMLLRKATR
jgi:dephospho-CoA kinase